MCKCKGRQNEPPLNDLIRAHIKNKTSKTPNLLNTILEKVQRMKALHIDYIFFPVLREKLMCFEVRGKTNDSSNTTIRILKAHIRRSNSPFIQHLDCYPDCLGQEVQVTQLKVVHELQQ